MAIDDELYRGVQFKNKKSLLSRRAASLEIRSAENTGFGNFEGMLPDTFPKMVR